MRLQEQVNEINGLSARVSARGNSSRIKSNGLSRNCNEPRSANLPGPIPLTSLSSNHTVVEGADEPAQDILSAMDHTMLEALEETSQDNIQEETQNLGNILGHHLKSAYWVPKTTKTVKTSRSTTDDFSGF